jgi:hypothetical protein
LCEPALFESASTHTCVPLPELDRDEKGRAPMRCSDGRAQLAWRPEAVGDILGVRRRSQESATAVGDPAAVGSLGTMVEHIFGYHMDRLARHLHAGAG